MSEQQLAPPLPASPVEAIRQIYSLAYDLAADHEPHTTIYYPAPGAADTLGELAIPLGQAPVQEAVQVDTFLREVFAVRFKQLSRGRLLPVVRGAGLRQLALEKFQVGNTAFDFLRSDMQDILGEPLHAERVILNGPSVGRQTDVSITLMQRNMQCDLRPLTISQPHQDIQDMYSAFYKLH